MAVKKAHAQVVKAQEKLADRRAREERDLAAEQRRSDAAAQKTQLAEEAVQDRIKGKKHSKTAKLQASLASKA